MAQYLFMLLPMENLQNKIKEKSNELNHVRDMHSKFILHEVR